MHVYPRVFHRAVPALLLLLPGILGAGRASADALILDGVAARVNDRFITVREVRDAAAPLLEDLAIRFSGDELQEEREKVFRQTRDALVDGAVLVEVFNQRKYQMPENLVDSQIETEIIGKRFNGDRQAFLSELERAGLTLADIRKRTREDIIAEMLRSDALAGKIPLVSPGEVRRRFEQIAASQETPTEVRLRVIQLDAPDDPAEKQKTLAFAERLRGQATNSTAFAILADANSTGSFRSRSGEPGWTTTIDRLNPALRAAAEALEPGQVSPPIDLGDVIFLVLLEERVDPHPPRFEDLREQIETDIKREARKTVYERWIESLRRGAVIRLYN